MSVRIITGIALSVLLLSSLATLQASAEFSGRVISRGTESTILIIFSNSSKSTEAVYEFTLDFTKGKPLSGIARGGWDIQKSGSVVTFATEDRPIQPGKKTIFIVKVSDTSKSAFQWYVYDKDNNELFAGEVSKIKIKEKKEVQDIIVTEPQISLDKTRVKGGDQVLVTGLGFTASTSVDLVLEDMKVTSVVTDEKGKFTSTILISNTLLPGPYRIIATDTKGKTSTTTLILEGVVAPIGQGLSLRLDKQEYKPGDRMKIVGTAANEGTVSLQVLDPQGNIICGANPAVNKATMGWEDYCTLPTNNVIAGQYTVKVTQIGEDASVRFTLKIEGSSSTGGTVNGNNEDPGTLKLYLNKTEYKSGDTVTLTLTGARANTYADITLSGPTGVLVAKRLSTDAKGSVTYDYKLVGAEPGTYKISARQDTFVVRAEFKVVQ